MFTSVVVDSHHFDADPEADPTYNLDADTEADPTYHFDADPDPDFCSM